MLFFLVIAILCNLIIDKIYCHFLKGFTWETYKTDNIFSPTAIMAPGALSILAPFLGRKSNKKYEKLQADDPEKRRQEATQEEINRLNTKIVSFTSIDTLFISLVCFRITKILDILILFIPKCFEKMYTRTKLFISNLVLLLITKQKIDAHKL